MIINSFRIEFKKIESEDVVEKRKGPPPFSMRATYEGQAQSEAEADGKPLGAYIREQLLVNDAAPRTRRGNCPVKDKDALGRVMGALGASRLSANLNQLAKALTGTRYL